MAWGHSITHTPLFRFDALQQADAFGSCVSGDVDGDGISDLIVGAPGLDGVPAGFARLYSGADGSVRATLTGGADGLNFGFSVSGVGDANLDGLGDFLVGRPVIGNGGFGFAQLYVSQAVPEPTSPAALAAGGAYFLGRRRRQGAPAGLAVVATPGGR